LLSNNRHGLKDMALPHFTEMIVPILRFGADGDINGDELRRRLPEIMKIPPAAVAILGSDFPWEG
jgi:hypothetical protein